MLLSIIIPNYNEEKSITEVMGQLLALNLPSFIKQKEIIIVDDASTDRSVEIIKNFISDKNTCQLFVH